MPPYLRRSKSIEELIPWLYLKGISTGDFQEALQALLGEDAKGLGPNVIVRLKEQWGQEYDQWSRRDLSDKQYVYIWADGIHANVRLEDEENQRQCMLVLMGATPDGHKELIAVVDGYRESEQSWYELLIGLKQRGLKMEPKLAVGDGALGFWAALRKVYGKTREQRCWFHYCPGGKCHETIVCEQTTKVGRNLEGYRSGSCAPLMRMHAFSFVWLRPKAGPRFKPRHVRQRDPRGGAERRARC